MIIDVNYVLAFLLYVAHAVNKLQINLPLDYFTEEVILAEERTTEEEKMHIIEGKTVIFNFDNDYISPIFCFQREEERQQKERN